MGVSRLSASPGVTLRPVPSPTGSEPPDSGANGRTEAPGSMVALAAIRYGLRTSAEMSRWRTGPFFSVVRTTIWRGKLGPADTAMTTGGSPLVARAAGLSA